MLDPCVLLHLAEATFAQVLVFVVNSSARARLKATIRDSNADAKSLRFIAYGGSDLRRSMCFAECV